MFELPSNLTAELKKDAVVRLNLDSADEYGGPSQWVTDTLALMINTPGFMPTQDVTGSFRTDAANTLALARDLEVIESRIYRDKLRELKSAQLIPVSNRDPAGSREITYVIYTKTGMAAIIANPSDNIPRSDAFSRTFTAKVRVSATSFGYSTQDLRQSGLMRVSIPVEKADAARRSMAEQRNEIAFIGNPEHDLLGFFTNPNIPEEEVVLNQATTSRLWVDKSPQEIIDDITGGKRRLNVLAKQVFPGPYKLLLPIDQHELIGQLRITDNFPTQTVSGWLTDPKNNTGIEEIVGVFELEGQGSGGTDMAVLYEMDDEVLEQRIPMPMIIHPPERRGLEFIINIEEELAGTVVRYPLAARQMFGI